MTQLKEYQNIYDELNEAEKFALQVKNILLRVCNLKDLKKYL